MFTFVLKHAVNLIEPLGMLWLVLLSMAVWLRHQGFVKPARQLFVLWSAFSIAACFPIGDRLLASLENPWREVAANWESLPPADVIMCLGGGASASKQEPVGVDFNRNAERPITSVELLRKGKAPLLIISGGRCGRGELTEAEAVKALIDRWQVTTARVMAFEPCADTHDEAVKFAAMAKREGWKRVLLVTSATHMRRAVDVFRHATDIEVVPVPCSFLTRAECTEWINLPVAGAFDGYSVWVHEKLGWWIYRVRGWL